MEQKLSALIVDDEENDGFAFIQDLPQKTRYTKLFL